MILTDSIIETVINSKFFIFIRNQALQNDYRTESPWIYLENKIAANCVCPQSKALLEDSQTAPQIRFKLVFKGNILYSVDEIINFIRSKI